MSVHLPSRKDADAKLETNGCNLEVKEIDFKVTRIQALVASFSHAWINNTAIPCDHPQGALVSNPTIRSCDTLICLETDCWAVRRDKGTYSSAKHERNVVIYDLAIQLYTDTLVIHNK